MRVTVITAMHTKTAFDKPKVFIGYGREDAQRAACNGFWLGEFDPTWLAIKKLLEPDEFGETDVDKAYQLLQEAMPRWRFHQQAAEVCG